MLKHPLGKIIIAFLCSILTYAFIVDARGDVLYNKSGVDLMVNFFKLTEPSPTAAPACHIVAKMPPGGAVTVPPQCLDGLSKKVVVMWTPADSEVRKVDNSRVYAGCFINSATIGSDSPDITAADSADKMNKALKPKWATGIGFIDNETEQLNHNCRTI